MKEKIKRDQSDLGGAMVICTECESDLDIAEDEVDEGEIVSCTECGTDFEVVTVNPLELNRIADEDDEDEKEQADDGDYS
jgi:alpha-aminoadipate/glutamate carrier protein LysW